MPSRLLQQENFFKSALTQELANDATRVYLSPVPSKSEGWLVIDQDNADNKEIIYYTSVGATYVDLPASGGRGVGGTSAGTHSIDDPIVMDDVAEYHNAVIAALTDYRHKAHVTFTGDTDNISCASGIVVVNSSVCTNTGAVTLTDIGAAGTNKSGSVASGGIRYIYAHDNSDGTFVLYVSNNTSESGKRRLGYAKFKEGSTTEIRYLYNDDDPSPLPRGSVLEYYGPSTDIPDSFAYCNGSNGTPDMRDKFSLCLGTTYSTLGAIGGAASIDFSHTHSISTEAAHSHTYSGTSDGISSFNYATYGGPSYQDESASNPNHKHTYSGTTATGGSHSHGGATGSSLTSQSILPPYTVIAKIMKI